MTDQITTRQYVTLDGQGFKALQLGALSWLEQHYQIVNQLNVFPVPDGDTGINMLLTMQSAYAEIADDPDPHIGNISRRFARGAVNGSRGNSGVILSQIWRGFSVALKDIEIMDAAALAQASRTGVAYAYDAAPKPAREGTILTVAREAAEKVEASIEVTQDLAELVGLMLDQARDALRRTPEMLDVLREAGVVDSGGQGFVFILEGALRHMRGESVEAAIEQTAAALPTRKTTRIMTEAEFGYPYDVQLMLSGRDLDEDHIRASIERMGDSAIVTSDGAGSIKVHVHVYDPGQPISYAAKLGIVSDVVVENMYEQYLENIGAVSAPPPTPSVELEPDDVAVVAVAPGDGLARIFYEQGAAQVIHGGQTMNPSTEDIYNAVMAVPANKVIILPNNKNIILAAQQAAGQITDRQVVIIESKNIPQGISAMLAYANARLNPALGKALDHVQRDMQAHLAQVMAGEVTRAVRSVELNGVGAREGQLIGLLDGELKVAGSQIDNVMQQLIGLVDSSAYELVTLYYGAEVSAAEAEALAAFLSEQYAALSFEALSGGQPHYYYLISVE